MVGMPVLSGHRQQCLRQISVALAGLDTVGWRYGACVGTWVCDHEASQHKCKLLDGLTWRTGGLVALCCFLTAYCLVGYGSMGLPNQIVIRGKAISVGAVEGCALWP
jgi:hypothetical protein